MGIYTMCAYVHTYNKRATRAHAHTHTALQDVSSVSHIHLNYTLIALVKTNFFRPRELGMKSALRIL